MSDGIAATEPTIGGNARMGVISTHGADIGFCSRIRISLTPPAAEGYQSAHRKLRLGRYAHEPWCRQHIFYQEPMQRVVFDTNVFVSAIMAPAGAPRHVLRLALRGEIAPIIGNALFCEYEDILARDALWDKCLSNRGERDSLADALMSVSNWMPMYFLWRPNLADEGGNHVLELAVAGGAEVIITANKRDFRRSNLLFPSVRIESAGEFLERRKP